jgi:hypothetical protein
MDAPGIVEPTCLSVYFSSTKLLKNDASLYQYRIARFWPLIKRPDRALAWNMEERQ